MTARVAVVTGGAAGIGRASALRLADECAAVVVVDVSADVEGVAAEIEARGAACAWFVADVAEQESASIVTREALRRFGSVDQLIHCAGVLGPEETVDGITEVDMRRVFEVNFYSWFHWLRAVLPGMRDRRWGRVVGITSGARNGQELRAAYASSKAALTALMRTAALENARFNVLVNDIEPGRTLTNMVIPRFSEEFLAAPPDSPIGRYADPAEIAEVVAFLCSEACTFAAGATFNVSGGAL